MGIFSFGEFYSLSPMDPEGVHKKYENWLNDEELEVYSNSFFINTFQPAINWYRGMTSFDKNSDLKIFSNKKIEVPSCFIAG